MHVLDCSDAYCVLQSIITQCSFAFELFTFKRYTSHNKHCLFSNVSNFYFVLKPTYKLRCL